MSNQSEITTFQFLEEIQSGFLKESGSEEGDGPYDTRRLINFINDSAKLHIIASPTSGSNGHIDILATLTLENVAQKGEQPTFAVKISAKPFDKTRKTLSLAYNAQTLKEESTKVLSALKDALSTAKAQESPAESSADGQSTDSPETSTDRDSGSSRIRRRSLRSRDSSSEDA